MTNELELFASEEAVVLPERESLALFNFASVNALNVASSSQTLTILSSSRATAGQVIIVAQS